jgi:hypothetical protein
MTNFDAPNRESSCMRRERSNTPLQALNLMNDVQYFEAARNFAQRLLASPGTTDSRITQAFRIATSRYPNAQEAEIIRSALDKHLTAYRAKPAEAKLAISYGESKADEKLDPSELAAWTLLANLLLNLDEMVTKG